MLSNEKRKCPANNVVWFVNTYPLDIDLSIEKHHPPSEQHRVAFSAIYCKLSVPVFVFVFISSHLFFVFPVLESYR